MFIAPRDEQYRISGKPESRSDAGAARVCRKNLD
jgi:hypothetical protein